MMEKNMRPLKCRWNKVGPLEDCCTSHGNCRFNNKRLLAPAGNIPSAETGKNYYAMLDETCIAA
jgi:hypothetical protein